MRLFDTSLGHETGPRVPGAAAVDPKVRGGLESEKGSILGSYPRTDVDRLASAFIRRSHRIRQRDASTALYSASDPPATGCRSRFTRRRSWATSRPVERRLRSCRLYEWTGFRHPKHSSCLEAMNELRRRLRKRYDARMPWRRPVLPIALWLGYAEVIRPLDDSLSGWRLVVEPDDRDLDPIMSGHAGVDLGDRGWLVQVPV